MKKFIIYTDGASKGNPGPASIGVVICDEKGNVLKECSKEIGTTTNNEAEYQAVIFGLKKIKALFGKKVAKLSEIEIRSDSELLVSQLNKKYKILDSKIQKLFIQLWNLILDFKDVKFILIPRQENKLADKLTRAYQQTNHQSPLL
ncbi:MAG: ribonuclease HI family protein [Candidatus Pacebacteria bacterium]|nr:ribonuclease HI family protein [Candidatus Paceibacterota bacterium]